MILLYTARHVYMYNTQSGLSPKEAPPIAPTAAAAGVPEGDGTSDKEKARTAEQVPEDERKAVDTAPSGKNRSRGNLAMAMRRRRSPPPPPPHALARACACARATTRPELGRSGGGGGAAQGNATTAAAWCPRHHSHAAALGCLACAAFRPTVFAHGRRRDE